MRPIKGNVSSRKNESIQVDFDKTGMIDKKKTNIYKLPVHDKGSLEFALKSVKATRVELRVDDTLLSVITPKYDDKWTEETITPLNFLGKPFHRGLLERPSVEVVVTTEDEKLPSIMVRIIENIKWENISGEVYEEEVEAQSDAGPKKLMIIYHREACGFRAL